MSRSYDMQCNFKIKTNDRRHLKIKTGHNESKNLLFAYVWSKWMSRKGIDVYCYNRREQREEGSVSRK